MDSCVATCTISQLRTRLSEMLSLSTFALEDSHGGKLSDTSMTLIGARILPHDTIRISMDTMNLTIGLPSAYPEEDTADTEFLQLQSVKCFSPFSLFYVSDLSHCFFYFVQHPPLFLNSSL